MNGGFILHFEIHGDLELQGLILSSGKLIEWEEIVDNIRPYNLDTLSSFDLQTKIVNEDLPLTNTKWDGIIQKARFS